DNLPCQGPRVGGLEPCVFFVFHQPIQAQRAFLPQIINRQIPRYRVKPCAEFVLAVVLMAAFEDANPRLLEEVFRQLTISREVDQIPKQSVLVLLDETIQQIRIAPAKTASDCAGFGLHAHHEVVCRGVHASWIYEAGHEKDAGQVTTSKIAASHSYLVSLAHGARIRISPSNSYPHSG